MIRKSIFFLATLMTAFVFSACETIECDWDDDMEGVEPSQMLTDGVWDLDWVEYTDLEDPQAFSWTEDFGAFSENGICTFEFGLDNHCIMIDEEEEAEERYVVYEDGNIRIGEFLYEVQELSESVFEIVAVSEDECWEEGELKTMHFER